ncbi:MAG: polyphenol oxidase family protein, partial [bacterium]
MTGTGPKVVAPTFERRYRHTWLTYPDFLPLRDADGRPPEQDRPVGQDTLDSPVVVHGVAVFRDTSFDSDREKWLVRAKGAVGYGLGLRALPGGRMPDRTAVEKAGLNPEQIIVPRQVHSAKVCDAGAMEEGEECDGLVTARAGVMVGVTVADCVPLLAANLEDRVVGAAHCGWRGTAAGIVGEFVDALDALGPSGTSGSAARYLIGPSIGPCCYEVGDDMLSHFSARDRDAFVIRRAGGDDATG